MQITTAYRRGAIAFLLAAGIAVAGVAWAFHDALLLSSLVLAAGLIWSSRNWKAWSLAAIMVGAGLWWSRFDPEDRRCTAWWRGAIVYHKLTGHLPQIGWKHIKRNVFWPCNEVRKPDPGAKAVVLLEEKVVEGRKRELYQTNLGKFWVAAPGRGLLNYLVWEMTVQSDYESGEVTIRPGDKVIDCGAHVGVFSRYALRRGAARVVAIEPDPTNLACLEANLAEEIASGQVSIIRAGVWNEKSHLTLFHALEEGNTGGHSFVKVQPSGEKVPGLLVLPLDEIVEQLKLDRVDFIKMDIEGSERQALQGAAQTIRRFKPRMAICAYHLEDDPLVLPAIVKKAQPSYQLHAKDVEFIYNRVTTKVLFFH